MKKLVNLQKIIITAMAAIIIVCCLIYKFNLSAVSSDDTIISFEVKENQTFLSLADELKKDNLIKSELFYKFYVKLTKPTGLQVGIYELSKNMSVDKIIKTLSSDSAYDTNLISITFKEGIDMRDFIEIITENTEVIKDDIVNTLSDQTYLSELINKYWFLTDEILNEDIYYALEGYLYPNTYEINKTWDIKKIFEVMLDEMENKLDSYKEDINNNEYTIHEILTLASIVELEGSNSDDRNGIAGVFYNRLENNWSLGSDVTTYYGIQVDVSQRDLYQSELNAYNAYNTRSSKMAGKLPVGPICNPSIESIEAAINPTQHNYYYFVADKNKKTYFSKTSSEHIAIVNELKSENLWYQY
ncbi:MAG: endolytic transglycosylase MltG [Bacilli bacterium]|nr:endolytic transglycosylase MltG [Bacilli bacterium]